MTVLATLPPSLRGTLRIIGKVAALAMLRVGASGLHVRASGRAAVAMLAALAGEFAPPLLVHAGEAAIVASVLVGRLVSHGYAPCWRCGPIVVRGRAVTALQCIADGPVPHQNDC